MAEYSSWNNVDYDFSKIQQFFELIIYSFLAFLVPFSIGHPQFVVGVAINFALVLIALNLKGYKLLPVIVLPSIAVFSRGLIFGSFTIFLIYLIPFIWIGNAIFVYAFKELKLRRKLNNILTLIIGAIGKTLFLFLCALLLVKSGIIPSAYLVSMGIVQLYTALVGGAIALGVHEAKKKYSKISE